MITTKVRMRTIDGQLVKVHPDGREEFVIPSPIRDMTDAQIEAAALSDPDAQPLTDEALKRMRRLPRSRTIRRAQGFTQEEFASRYHIPLGTLRDWEQGRSEPDAPAKAFLEVIAREPEMVAKALAAKKSAA